jgi:MYXO-CTERM domain-containing protein
MPPTTLPGAVVGGPDWDPQTLTFSTGGSDLIKRVRVTVEFVPGADFGMLDHLVVYSAIPEPEQTAGLAALGLAGLALWRRCARRN